MKAIKLLFVCMFLIPLHTFSQFKIDSSGRTILGNEKTYQNGFSLYDTSGTTPARFYRLNDILYLNRGETTSGLKIDTKGRFLISENNLSSINFNGRFYVGVYNESAMLLRSFQDFDHGDILKIVSARALTTPIASFLDQQRTFYVKGNGDVYATEYYVRSDKKFKKNIETIENPVDKIMQLRGVTYNLTDPVPESIVINEDYEDGLQKIRSTEPCWNK